jgi:hypothetical protein
MMTYPNNTEVSSLCSTLIFPQPIHWVASPPGRGKASLGPGERHKVRSAIFQARWMRPRISAWSLRWVRSQDSGVCVSFEATSFYKVQRSQLAAANRGRGCCLYGVLEFFISKEGRGLVKVNNQLEFSLEN